MQKKYYPLTNAQRSIWVADNLYPGTGQAISQATAVINQDIDFKLMNVAINTVIKENDALRIRLVNDNGTPKQYFADFTYRNFDVFDFSYENGEQDFKEWETKTTETPFSLINSELLYFAMIKLSDHKNIGFFKFHHITTDAWGVVLVIRKTLEKYWKLTNGLSVEDSEEPSYIDHINDEMEYMASERFTKHKNFWSEVFETVPEFISFTENKGFSSILGRRKSYILSDDLSVKLQSFCETNKVSLFSVFYALLAIYLFKRSCKKDVTIETPILNRSGHKEKNTAGLFMHNIPTRIFVEPSQTFLTFVNDSFRELKKFMRYQRYPHNYILKDFREKHQFSGALVDVTLNYHNIKLDSIIDYEGIWNYPGAQSNSLSICVSDRDGIGVPKVDYDYLLEVFSEVDIDQMHNHMCNLLFDGLENPEKTISELEMLSIEEQKKLLVDFNQTYLSYDEKTVSHLFEEQVIKTPDNKAIIFKDKSLTYSELNEKANQLARYLQIKGVTRNSIIGIMVNRSLEMVIGILGILKAGAAYLPLDPEYPRERIGYMLNKSQTRLTLVDKDLYPEIETCCEYVNISLSNSTIYTGISDNLDNKDSAINDLAYVLFTSGSTGQPKGVLVHHRALCNLANSVAKNLNLKNDQTIVSLTTISFDIFFSDTILPLTQGMKVIIASEEEQNIPKYLFDLIVRHKIDILQVTPSRMKLIMKENQGRECLQGLSHLLITGEAFPPYLLPEVKSMTRAEIYNLYGPTETTVWSTISNVTQAQKLTIGKPIANTQIYILNENLSLLPIGVVGEIYISGDGVSLGYLNNDDLTKERFLTNPFVPGSRMYRTGDLGRWLDNGEIECLGRNDNQVKIRGFRIELEEIEACLIRNTSIKEAVVVLKEDKLGRKQLCAYLTGDPRLSNEELKDYVMQSLPNYMVPSFYMWLDSIPLTPNGKVNRNALPAPNEVDYGQTISAFLAPRNDIEQKMANLWGEALGIERLGIDDNLFVLGGDSLTILEIISGAIAYNWKINAQDFYECPTIRQLSSKISGTVEKNARNDMDTYVSKREIPEDIIVESVNIGNVLLTGATGFLGMHLLVELLNQTESMIYCLVRGIKASQRIDKLLEFYFPILPKTFKNRIVVVEGDLTQENFGLTNFAYQELAQKVKTVIHCGAIVKHYGDYSEFKASNVKGTDEVINFCMLFGKRLNYISTISVSGESLGDQFKEDIFFSERDFYIGQNFKSNVYIRSKFEAEQQIIVALSNGLEATIFRVGVLTGRYRDGKFQHNIDQNAYYRKLKSIISLEAIPVSFLDQNLEFTPVDSCSKAIIKIIEVNQTNGLVFHLFNPHKMRAIELISYLRLLEYPVKLVDNGEFELYIDKLSRNKEGKEVLSGLAIDLITNKNLKRITSIKVDSEFTINYLKQVDFEWPEINIDYLRKILDYMQEVGFINDSEVSQLSLANN